MSGKTVC